MIADPFIAMIGFILAIGLYGLAALFGRGAAPRAAMFVGVGCFAGWLVGRLLPGAAEMAVSLAVDIALLVALASLAWKPATPWPLLLVGLQGLVIALHLLRLLEPERPAATFAIAFGGVEGAKLLTIGYAAVTSRRRLPS